MTSIEQALKNLALRTLEYVGFEDDKELECDAAMRREALEGLRLLGIDPAHEMRRYQRDKKRKLR